MIPTFTIRVAQGEESDTAAPLVKKLLDELGEEGDDTGVLDVEAVKRAWRGTNLSLTFIASSSDNRLVGIATVVECFAIYANGNYRRRFQPPQPADRYRSRHLCSLGIVAAGDGTAFHSNAAVPDNPAQRWGIG